MACSQVELDITKMTAVGSFAAYARPTYRNHFDYRKSAFPRSTSTRPLLDDCSGSTSHPAIGTAAPETIAFIVSYTGRLRNFENGHVEKSLVLTHPISSARRLCPSTHWYDYEYPFNHSTYYTRRDDDPYTSELPPMNSEEDFLQQHLMNHRQFGGSWYRTPGTNQATKQRRRGRLMRFFEKLKRGIKRGYWGITDTLRGAS
ncbi:hypothetical protein LshimejAT787_0704460 [Lyophyllum shimeji]|uniref:Uncharacterized protein n=1 Tax=Lyophyllum shimeji TaxID=47721 RepID=A0A9P3PQJ3_LYOSH|nr:hypothetical protein LshimejAT787_0704460 [Lyophyllum shimeji]